MARPAYSEDQIEAIHAEIRAHSIALFREGGVRGLTLRAVAKRMDWSAAALYRYFENKEDLLDSLRAEGFTRAGYALAQARESVDEPADAPRAVIRAYLDFAMEEPELFQLMFQLDQGAVPSGPKVRVERERAFEEARAVGVVAVEAGVFEGDANVAAHVLWAACHGLATLAIANQLDLGCRFEDLIDPLIERLTAPLA
jgi:AcrR family transcriptional regulator